MKKYLSLSLAIILCLALSVCALADGYTINDQGDAVYESAVGYTFHIDSVNGPIYGEDSSVYRTTDEFAACTSSWAIWFIGEKVEGNVYKAVTDGAGMNGAKPSYTLKADQIAVVIHSSTSNPDNAATYPNWEDKVAALAVKTGDYLAFTGVDFAAGTTNDGKLTVTDSKSKALSIADAEQAPIDEPSEEPVDEPSEEPVDEPSEEPVDEPSEEPVDEPSHTEEPSAAEESEQEQASDVVSSEVESEEGGIQWWVWVIIAVAVVLVVCCIVVFAKKKK